MIFFNILNRTIFWLSIAFIAIVAFSLTIGRQLPIEFSNYKTRNQYYDSIFFAVPGAILLTMAGTIKKKRTKSMNWMIGILTVLSAVLSFFFLLGTIFSIASGAWINEATLYRNKIDSNITINNQFYDAGALDIYSHRTVMLTPFLKWFQKVQEIDTNKIDKTKWIDTHQVQ